MSRYGLLWCHGLSLGKSLSEGTLTKLSTDGTHYALVVSALSLGGLVKHLAAVERQWARFVTDGPAATPDIDWASVDWAGPRPRTAPGRTTR